MGGLRVPAPTSSGSRRPWRSRTNPRSPVAACSRWRRRPRRTLPSVAGCCAAEQLSRSSRPESPAIEELVGDEVHYSRARCDPWPVAAAPGVPPSRDATAACDEAPGLTRCTRGRSSLCRLPSFALQEHQQATVPESHPRLGELAHALTERGQRVVDARVPQARAPELRGPHARRSLTWYRVIKLKLVRFSLSPQRV